MTYAEGLLKEGEAWGREVGLVEGDRKAKPETAERMLELGLGWDTVREATGVAEFRLAAFRKPVSGA